MNYVNLWITHKKVVQDQAIFLIEKGLGIEVERMCQRSEILRAI